MNPLAGAGRDITEIVVLAFMVGLVGMLIVNSQGTVNVLQGGSNAVSGLLATATFQRSNVGNVFNPL